MTAKPQYDGRLYSQAEMDKMIVEARINERNQVALDNYRGKTVSESTNWAVMFGRFITGNERAIAELFKTLKEHKEK